MTAGGSKSSPFNRGAETRLAGKWYAMLILAARADVEGITAVGVAAEDHALDGLADVGALVCGDLVFDAQIAPGVPVVAEDVTETVVTGGVSGVAPGG